MAMIEREIPSRSLSFHNRCCQCTHPARQPLQLPSPLTRVWGGDLFLWRWTAAGDKSKRFAMLRFDSLFTNDSSISLICFDSHTRHLRGMVFTAEEESQDDRVTFAFEALPIRS